MNSEELVVKFAGMTTDEQAEVFNKMLSIGDLPDVLAAVGESTTLTYAGRIAMAVIGSHAEIKK